MDEQKGTSEQVETKEIAMSGADLIAAERQRQIEQEGWTADGDAKYLNAELINAAKTYAEEASFQVRHPEQPHDPTLALTIQDLHGWPATTWPWAPEWWKPSPDPVRNLVKAGALIAAEIDRLQAVQKAASRSNE